MVQLKRRSKDKSGESDEYGTPQILFNVLNAEFCFGCDVCASEKNHKHEIYYDIEKNGLLQPWYWVNWCNPPYSKILPWVQKAISERDDSERGADKPVNFARWFINNIEPILEVGDE